MQRSLEISQQNATILLGGVADRVKSGPYRGEWMLKPEYAQPVQAAMDAEAGS